METYTIFSETGEPVSVFQCASKAEEAVAFEALCKLFALKEAICVKGDYCPERSN